MQNQKNNRVVYKNFIQCGKCGTVVYAGLGRTYCPFCGTSVLHKLEDNNKIQTRGFLDNRMYW